MEINIIEQIRKHETIIIHRHKFPDLDAYGSQLGLKELIKENFKEKLVYVVGDTHNYPFDNTMDEISDETYNGALVFVLDTADERLISDKRYQLGKTLINIDHHQNLTNIKPLIFYHKPNLISCSQMIADIAMIGNLKLNDLAASHIYAGIVGDSGRFQYITNDNAKETFKAVSFLMEYQVDIKKIYDFQNLETLDRRIARDQFREFNITKNNVAYRFNDLKTIKDSKLSFFDISRGTVNLMSGIEEVQIWANFSEKETGEIIGEFRARDLSIVDIAKKFGGGGHNQACGATLTSWEECLEVVKCFDERMKEQNDQRNI
ncbi:DHH family phosphoesterase [Acholeplasma granularum]|uniref:DHH family phosphoesterase n=1 Tax=Acholeplasma granularum TaxID=264635 RepID=UPI00046E7D90|nr:bifunctional oligoribonuclease/PAP phosphatase NrnA [Acholeplasma granularum]